MTQEEEDEVLRLLVTGQGDNPRNKAMLLVASVTAALANGVEHRDRNGKVLPDKLAICTAILDAQPVTFHPTPGRVRVTSTLLEYKRLMLNTPMTLEGFDP